VNPIVVSTRSHVSEGPPCLPTQSLREVICEVTRAQGAPFGLKGSWYGTSAQASFRWGRGSDAEFLRRTSLCVVIRKTFGSRKPSNVAPLVAHDSFLLHEGKIAVPHAFGLRAHLLHDSPYAGHQGVNKTLNLVARHYWWSAMTHYVQYMTHCHLCQKNKARSAKPSGLLHPLELPHKPWDTVTMNFITQLPRTKDGHDAILVVVDKLSKMVHLVATKTTATAMQTAKLFLDHIWKLHGMPRKVTGIPCSQTTSLEPCVACLVPSRKSQRRNTLKRMVRLNA
jgi:hypothetical protein